jgi:hypothetical protein
MVCTIIYLRLRLRFSSAHATSVAALLVASLYGLPHFLEYTVVLPGPEMKPTELRKSRAFSILYTGLADVILRTLLPATVMLYTGVRVWQATQAAGASACRRATVPARSLLLANAGLVAIFLATHSLKVFYNVYSFVSPAGTGSCVEDLWLMAIYEVARVLLAAGCSLNLIIYLAVGERFRRTFFRLFDYNLYY